MKKLILLLLLLSILFQSCFSYKAVEVNSIESEKNQKFKVAKLDRTNIKGRLVSINEKTMILENNGESQTILKDEINYVKVRKFSILKSAGVIASTLVTYVIYAVLFTVATFP